MNPLRGTPFAWAVPAALWSMKQSPLTYAGQAPLPIDSILSQWIQLAAVTLFIKGQVERAQLRRRALDAADARFEAAAQHAMLRSGALALSATFVKARSASQYSARAGQNLPSSSAASSHMSKKMPKGPVRVIRRRRQ